MFGDQEYLLGGELLFWDRQAHRLQGFLIWQREWEGAKTHLPTSRLGTDVQTQAWKSEGLDAYSN